MTLGEGFAGCIGACQMRGQEASLAKGPLPIKAAGMTSMQLPGNRSCSVLLDLKWQEMGPEI